MRFIIHELAHERPLAAGLWRYAQGEAETGAVESWRLTAAPQGYHFLRVDLDARAAPSGRSTLYHLTVDPQGRPAQLRYRLWTGGGAEVRGTAVFEPDTLILVTEQRMEREEQVLELPPEFAFRFPAASALSLLVNQARELSLPALMLRLDVRGQALVPHYTELLAAGDGREGQPIALRWENQQRLLWLDEKGWPRRMERQDGLTAVETRLVHYEQNEKRPWPVQ